MKTGVSLLISFLLFASLPLSAEDLLSRKLSVSFNRVPVKQALDEVARLADFEWSYNARILDQTRLVTLNARNWTVREVLMDLLGPDYSYKSNGRYLILKKQKQPESVLSGVIRDPKTGERLANTTVYDRKSLRAVVTDSSGYYRLKVKGKSELVVSRLGYRDTVLQVTSTSPRFQKIELSPVPVPPRDSAESHSLKQTVQKTLAGLERFFAAAGDKWHNLNVPDTLRRHFQISFLPMVGTNHILSGKVENDWSVNVLAGVSAGVRRFEAAGVGNFTRKEVQGAQAAGVFNVNRGACTGAQAAGVFNYSADSLRGAQMAGVFNVNRGAVRGVQAAGVWNFSTDSLSGAQLAGVFNHLNGRLRGVQAAGVCNLIADTIQGAQIAGVVNVNQGRTTGVQVAGVSNFSSNLENGVQIAGVSNVAGTVTGMQVAGVTNTAKKVRGIQIGLINHAGRLNGVQIGLINHSGKRWTPILNWNGLFGKK